MRAPLVKSQLIYCLFLSDICSLSVNVGPCEGLFPRWYFDSESGKCERFAYGGCDGNDNRFTTLTDCINTCGE